VKITVLVSITSVIERLRPLFFTTLHQILQVTESYFGPLHVWCFCKTGSSYPILEMCEFWFRQFSVSSSHVFLRIGTNFNIENNLSNVDFILPARKFGPRDIWCFGKTIELNVQFRPEFDITQLCLF